MFFLHIHHRFHALPYVAKQNGRISLIFGRNTIQVAPVPAQWRAHFYNPLTLRRELRVKNYVTRLDVAR
jgi:hypothetical protein